VASDYRRVDSGIDANGKRWEIGVRGANVLVHASPNGLVFDGDGREQFTRAWIRAEHEAEAHGIPAVVTSAALIVAVACQIQGRAEAQAEAR
jgi:hypothetical protein